MTFKIITTSILVIMNIGAVYAQEKPKLNDNFYKNINYDWLNKTKIPETESSISPFTLMGKKVSNEIRKVVQSPKKAKTTIEKKVKDLYFSYMDKKTRNKLGLKPIKKYLLDIDKVKNHNELALLMAEFDKDGIDTPFKFEVVTNPKNAQRHILQVYQSGISIAREFYISKDKRSIKQKKLYAKLLSKFFKLSSFKNVDKRVKNVITIESKIAKDQFSLIQNRDLSKIFNFYTYKELLSLLNNYPLEEIFSILGIKQTDAMIVNQPSYLKRLNKLFVNISVSSWKDYLRAKVLYRFSNMLTTDYEKAQIAFYKQIGLIKKEKSEWKKGVDFIGEEIPMMVGQVYIDNYFDQKTRVYINKIVKAIKNEYKITIENSKLFSKATKEKALKKLDTMAYNIGAPDNWQDFSKLKIDKYDLVGNSIRISRFKYKYMISKLNKPVDRKEWNNSPHLVNAAYNPFANQFVLFAAVLNKPAFDINAADAQNFGGIGFIIGHEIGHAFDDRGSKFDEKGNFSDWWTKEDKKSFAKIRSKLIAQANKYQPLPNIYLNGELKVSEIIGDLNGAQIAFNAYVRFAKESGVDTKENRKKFFIQIAKIWREKKRKEDLMQLLENMPHPNGEYRVNGTLKNIDAFHNTFNIKSGDKMYREPSQRVKMW